MKLAELVESAPNATAMDALEALGEKDAVLWCALNRRVKTEPLTFDNTRRLQPETLETLKRTLIKSDYEDQLHVRLLHHRPFLKQPLRDKHKHKVCEKGRQIGASENMVSEEFHFLATHPGTKVVHTFPRDKQLADFSTTRIAGIFAESPRMMRLAGTPNQVMTKRVGESFLILRSAWESNLGEGIDADMVVLDEKDRMRDKVELAFSECLKSSRYGLMREISTPTLPGKGIDKPFRDSDQQVWLVKCKKCNLEQEVDWKENIIQVKDVPLGCKELPPDSYDYLCRKQECRGQLDRVYSGRWVPRFPDRKHIRGYHISQLIAPWISATRVMQDKIDFRWIQPWLNYVCGLPASGDLDLLTDLDFELCSGGYDFFSQRTRDFSQVSVGVDWGIFNWVVVMGRNNLNQRPYVLSVGIFEDDPAQELGSAKEAYKFMMPFNPDIVIADAGFGKDRNSYLFRQLCPNQTEGRFYAQWYNPSVKSSRTFQPEWSDPQRARVLVDRTMQLKNVCHAVKEREFGLPSMGLDRMQLLRRHFRALTPMKEIDEDTKELVETISSSGDDHLAHALASAWLGMERLAKTSKFSASFV